METQKSEPAYPICQHIKTNGLRCGSPALRERRFCFFHHRMHDLRRLRRERPHGRLELPLLEDANAIQVAVQEVLAAVTDERLDPRRAGLMLYGLNTAASNLKRLDFEPRLLREYADHPAWYQNNELARILFEEILCKPKDEEEAQSAIPVSA